MNQQELNKILDEHEHALKGVEGANLAELYEQNLSGLDLSNRNLISINLNGAYLQNCNFENTDLSHAVLGKATMIGCNLKNTTIENAGLSHCDFIGADLSGAVIFGCAMQGAKGNMKEIKSLQIDTYAVAWTSKEIQIGFIRVPLHRFVEQGFIDTHKKGLKESGFDVEWLDKWYATLCGLINH